MLSLNRSGSEARCTDQGVDFMPMHSYIYLKPLTWTQEIRYYSHLGNDEGGNLSADCAPSADCDLMLRDGVKLRDFQIIPISFLQEKLEEPKLEAEAIGELWSDEGQTSVNGWLHFEPKNYSALWDQVRTGNYASCQICLGVHRPDDIWKENPLSITSASVTFARKPDTDERLPRKGFFSAASRR